VKAGEHGDLEEWSRSEPNRTRRFDFSKKVSVFDLTVEEASREFFESQSFVIKRRSSP